MRSPVRVIINGRNEFFCGDWSQIRWTTQYSEARLYYSGYVLREASKLYVEVSDTDLPVRIFSEYGTKEEIELIFTHGTRW